MSKYYRPLHAENLSSEELEDLRTLGLRAFLNEELTQTEVCIAASYLARVNGNGPDGTLQSLREAYEQLYTS